MKSLIANMQICRRAFQALGLTAFALFFVFAATLPAFAATNDNNAMVRVVHASPDAGNVDVYVDGNKLLSNFTFGTVTDYVSVPAGSHHIQVTPAGKDVSSAVITQDVSVQGGMAYTVAAIGTTSSGFSLTAFVDNNMIADGSKAKVRVYHLSPDAGPVNVAAGGNTLISGLDYKSASDYLTVPAAAYNFTVTATNSNAQVPLSATLQSNMVYSVFAVGLLKGSPALTFKVATVAAVPGMPNTGSDPSAQPVAPSQPYLPWLVAACALIFLTGAGFTLQRATRAREK
jgi:hypothetical protein